MEESHSYNSSIELPPGFRFHPTDEELVTYYLSPKVLDSNFTTKAIGEVNLNKVEPWDLPWKAKFGEREWYFFCLRDRKYPGGSRTNRATVAGYWKATGKDKEIFRAKLLVGMKKTLVFYRGRAPKGIKSNWVMHEYRLQGKNPNKTAKGEWVICRAFKKSSGGNKVHISGLLKSVDSCLDLPPLTDLSSDESTRCAQGSHVTCFSNLKQDHQDNSLQEYTSSSSNSNFLYPNSLLSSQLNPILKQEQTTLCHLFKTNSSCIKQNVAAELYQDIDLNREMHTAFSMYDAGLGPYGDDHQEIDLDCLWNF